jgi:phosphoribosylglycinamide formyltransferase 1
LLLFNDDEEQCERGLLDLLEKVNVDFIALLGYLKKLPDSVVKRFENRILNVHPALLPSFGGLNMYGDRVHEAVLARGCKVSGATVHFVSSDYDEGPIVLQECCVVKRDDTTETLSLRVREIEHRIIPQAIQLLVSDKLTVKEGKVYFSE